MVDFRAVAREAERLWGSLWSGGGPASPLLYTAAPSVTAAPGIYLPDRP